MDSLLHGGGKEGPPPTALFIIKEIEVSIRSKERLGRMMKSGKNRRSLRGFCGNPKFHSVESDSLHNQELRTIRLG